MKPIKNIVVISDTHFGCKFGLCPPEVQLDGGGKYRSSRLQLKVWWMWLDFWKKFVPSVTENEPYIIVHNGDVIDGVHHNSTTQISHNLVDQRNLAIEVLGGIIKEKNCKGYFQIRGTEAHVGQSAEHEEQIAKELKAVKDEIGQFSRYELWLEFGEAKLLAHFTHHIATTNSAAYESTAPHKELVEAYVEAGKWKLNPPDVIVRSHRHRYYQNLVPGKNINAISVITPAWQLKTPFVYRGTLGRTSTPQIGGIIIREGKEVPLYVRHYIQNVERSKKVSL